MNTGPFSTSACFTLSMVWILEKPDIALGAGGTITGYNQLMVATNVTQFNIPGLVASTLSQYYDHWRWHQQL